MSKILAPIDFSDCSHGLVDHAADLARRLQSELVLCHVISAPTEGADAPLAEGDGARRLLQDEARDTLLGFAQRARKTGIEVGICLAEGTPAQAILGAAERYGVEFIVMGTHGRRGVLRFALGSVAENVARRAAVPVMTVRTQHRPECDAINCAVCGSHRSPMQARVAAELDG